MTHVKITFATVAAAMALSNGAALAAAPEECRTSVGTRSYNAAYDSQVRFLENIFETQYGCDRLESFSRMVPRLLITGPTATDVCRAAGHRDAAADTIDKYTRTCLRGAAASSTSESAEEVASPIVSCARNGADEGEMRAALYCAQFEGAAEMMPGGPPVSICSRIASLTCENAFRAHVLRSNLCRAGARRDPSFESAVTNACAIQR